MREIVLLFIVLLMHSPLFSQLGEQKIIPVDNASGDFFGRYLCLKSGDLLIGAHEDDENGYASGSVYLFQLDPSNGQFKEKKKFFPADGDVEEFFGYSIDIFDNWAITGSHHDSDFGGSSGSAFLFFKENNTWFLDRKIWANEPYAGDEFGKSVGIWEDQLAIGAFLEDWDQINCGSVSIYDFKDNDWHFKEKIQPLDPVAYDQFGHFMVFRDVRIVVGVPEKQGENVNSGCIYIFEQDENKRFIQKAKILDPDGRPGDHFGQAVETTGDWVAVGAYKADNPLVDGGAVYLYKYHEDQWSLVQKIIPPDNEEGDHFGSAISMDGNILAIGAYFDDDNGLKSGSVYLYEEKDGQYVFLLKLLASDGSFGDAFGSAVDLDVDHLVVGAYADSENGFFSGSAYIYDLSPLTGVKVYSDNEKAAELYPNLIENKLVLHINDPTHLPAKYVIRDISGQFIQQGQLGSANNNLYVPAISSGMYIIEIDLGNSRKLFKFYKK